MASWYQFTKMNKSNFSLNYILPTVIDLQVQCGHLLIACNVTGECKEKKMRELLETILCGSIRI